MQDNKYTLFYALAMTLIVAISLSLVSEGLKPKQEKNVALDKKRSILNSVTEATMENADDIYEERIEEMVVDVDGKKLEGVQAFDVNLQDELKKEPENRQLPLYLYTDKNGNQNYIFPLRGSGLWGPIYGYAALENDLSTVAGVSFGHDSETPGLGAEITTNWFQEQFVGKKLVEDGDFRFQVLKGTGNDLTEHQVDGISGATITADGVQDMLEAQYQLYSTYFKKIKNQPS